MAALEFYAALKTKKHENNYLGACKPKQVAEQDKCGSSAACPKNILYRLRLSGSACKVPGIKNRNRGQVSSQRVHLLVRLLEFCTKKHPHSDCA